MRLYLRVLNYFRTLKRLFLPAFISYFIVATAGYVLVFTVLPQYIRYTEPWPYTNSLLLALIYTLLMALFPPLIMKDKRVET